MDWDLCKTFVAVAETRSFAAAALASGLAHGVLLWSAPRRARDHPLSTDRGRPTSPLRWPTLDLMCSSSTSQNATKFSSFIPATAARPRPPTPTQATLSLLFGDWPLWLLLVITSALAIASAEVFAFVLRRRRS